MASLTRRGARYYVRVYVNGRQREIATKTSCRKVAEKIKQKLEYEQATGILQEATQTPLDELLTNFVAHLRTRLPPKSVNNDISRLRSIFGAIVPALEPARKRPNDRRVLANLPPTILAVSRAEDITTPLINRRLEERAQVVGPKTLNEERAMIHRLLAYAIDFHGMIHPDRRTPNPAAKARRWRVPAPTIRFLTLEQVQEQLKALEDAPTIRTAVAIMIYAGLRRSETLWLQPQDIDRKSRLIRVQAKHVGDESWQPKTRRNRAVPISHDLGAILDEYRVEQNRTRRKTRNRGHDQDQEQVEETCSEQDYKPSHTWLILSPRGQRYDPDNFSQDLATANLRHGLRWTSLHYRHTFGSLLAQRGVSLFKISTMMGNSPEICRRHYAALVPGELLEDVEFT
ncbi:MAG: tyrosine-type recombinase/integrase [Phycisphaerales bacterium]|nr:tyrosine-type recombinase/integrase [Phycisphaerales bacterium]